MQELEKSQFYNPTKGNLSVEETLDEIVGYMTNEPDKFYDIIVGCDSPSSIEPNFPVAVVTLKVGEGGRFFLKKTKYQKKFYHWRQRILQEVLLSCEMAMFLKEKLEQKLEALAQKPNYQFCYIHADVGERGQTKDMIREVTGLIRGNGFEPKIKPEACVASILADRYT